MKGNCLIKLKCPICNRDLIKNSGFGVKEIDKQIYVIFIASCECSKDFFYVKMKVDSENIELYKEH